MKLEFSIAADWGLVVRSPHPTSAPDPAGSNASTPSTPMRETGSCAPTSAHPTPSRSRYLARSRTLAGTSVSVVAESQVARRPVGPAGSVAARPTSRPAAATPGAANLAVVLL